MLAAIDDEGVDAVWCLGDHVGYGPRPNECCALVADRAETSLVGNHDLGVLGALDLADFSPDAAAAARWTREVLTAPSRRYLAGLSPSGGGEEIALYHGSPRDPVWDYVLTVEGVYDALTLTSAPVVLVGHSHVALAVSLDEERLAGGLAPAGTDLDLDGRRWLLNPGSVGQPRDGDPRAAFLLLDLAARAARFRRITYPVERTQSEVRAEGLPESLAARLEHGY